MDTIKTFLSQGLIAAIAILACSSVMADQGEHNNQSCSYHFAIHNSGGGSNCQSMPVTITLHDSDHHAHYSGGYGSQNGEHNSDENNGEHNGGEHNNNYGQCGSPSTVTLSTSSNHGVWVDQNGNTLAGNQGNGAAVIDFSGKNSVTVYFKDTTAESTHFYARGNDGSKEEDDEDDDANFGSSGGSLRFVDANGNPVIGPLLSGADKTYYLQAVSSSCTPLFTSAGTYTVGLASQCINPVSCPGNAKIAVNGTAISNNPGNYTPVQLTFSNNAAPLNNAAPIKLNYPEAGNLKLFASYSSGSGNSPGNSNCAGNSENSNYSENGNGSENHGNEHGSEGSGNGQNSGCSTSITGSSAPFDVNPHHFAVLSSSVADAFPAAKFTYSRQPFGGDFTLEARNAQNGRTLGYTGSFAALDPASDLLIVNSATSQPYDDKLLSFKSGATFTDTPGQATISAKFTWNMGLQAPTVSTAQLTGIASLADSKVTDASDVAGSVPLGKTTVRYGRLALSSSYGSELLAMNMPIEVQYWNGNGFILNSDDSSSVLSIANVQLSNFQRLQPGDVTASVSASPLKQGHSNIRLSAPGAGKTGSVDVCIDLDSSSTTGDTTCQAATAANQAYLQNRWQGANGVDKDPRARATFGVFRNSATRTRGANFIDMRERF